MLLRMVGILTTFEAQCFFNRMKETKPIHPFRSNRYAYLVSYRQNDFEKKRSRLNADTF